MFDYAGSFHIHSSYSFDGRTGMEEIIAAAKRQGLDFIVVTDHFRLDAKKDGWEGWHGGVLVIVGEEISPRYNHYLALGIEKPVIAWEKNSKPQNYIDAVSAQGGFGLIAHPDHTGAPRYGIKDYPWKDWAVSGFCGISVWDLMTDWQEKLVSPLAALKSYVFPAWSLSGPKKETLKRWDELNKKEKVAGYGEIDNHNSRKRFYGHNFNIFPFDLAFKTIRTRVLTDRPLDKDPKTAVKQLCDAVKSRRMYVAQEKWKSAKGFIFRIYNENAAANTGEEFFIGSGKKALVEARLPGQGVIRLIKDGQTIAEASKTFLQSEVNETGVYRIEAEQRVFGVKKPWIYSNPIWVNKKSA